MPAEKETLRCKIQVKEIFAGKCALPEIIAELILNKHRKVTKKHWTDTQSQAIIKLSTVEDGDLHLQS